MPQPQTFARYVAIGDSSTEGIDDPDGEGGYHGWSQRLAERIDAEQDTNLLYANLAVRGLNTRQIRERQLEAALAMKPDMATLFCGTNDVTSPLFDSSAVSDDIAHMQRTLVDAGATVLSFTLPDLTPLARLIAPSIAAMNQALNLPDTNDAWRQPFPTALVQSRAQWCATEMRLITRHLFPWIWQGLQGKSAGDGRACKRPELAPL